MRFSKTYRFATLKVFPYLIAFRIEDDKKLIYHFDFSYES